MNISQLKVPGDPGVISIFTSTESKQNTKASQKKSSIKGSAWLAIVPIRKALLVAFISALDSGSTISVPIEHLELLKRGFGKKNTLGE